MVVLVALPVTGLVVGTLGQGPVAKADDAPAQLVPSEGPAPRTSQPARRAPTVSDAPVRKAEGSSYAGRVPEKGSGRFRTADVKGAVVGEKGQLLRYVVRVERELPFDPESAARGIQGILSDVRSWTGSGERRFQLIDDPARADFFVLIATPKTTDRYCLPLHTWGRLSCQDGPRAVLNARRWAFGASTYKKDDVGYRRYLVNHEVGHVLGFGHERCPKRGARAPVMVQQTKSLQGCRANPWPAPKRR